MLLRILLTLISISICSHSWATDYYVSNNGTEIWPNCITQSNPCLASNTSKDFLSAVAGDTVYFLDGIYSGLIANEYASDYRIPSWYPVNNGTIGNPIVFKALNRRAVTLRGLLETTGEGGVAVIGSHGTDTITSFVTFSGFNIEAVNQDGAKVMGMVYLYNSDNYTVDDCSIDGGEMHHLGGTNNYEGIRVEGSSNVTILNCEIFNWNEVDHNHNTSGFKSYASTSITIKNNSFHNNYTNIYLKGGLHDNFYIYNNLIAGGDAILSTTNSADKNYLYIYNNVFSNTDIVYTDDGETPYNINNMFFYNNTIYSNDGVNIDHASSINETPIVYGNIIYLTEVNNRSLLTRRNGFNTFNECDHNLFYPYIDILLNRYDTEREYTTLTDWQSSGELSDGSNPGAGSLAVDPLFLNTSGTMTQLDDFRLASNSPAKGAGRGGVDMGADIDLVGVNAGETCDSSHLDLCNDPTSCEVAGGNWCAGVCQSEPCATAFNCGAVPIMQVN